MEEDTMTDSYANIPGVAQEFPQPASKEEFAYIDVAENQVYTAIHHTRSSPRAQIILAPPFGIERTFAYTTLVRLARAIAHCDYQVVRFDFRSMGESSGETAKLGISDWLDDARAVFDKTECLAHGRPRIIAGLRFGAFVAGSLFSEGIGDALLALDPPAKLRQMLMELLRRKLAEDFCKQTNGNSRNRSDYIDELKNSGIVEVDGYLWGRKLWSEAEKAVFPIPAVDEPRPVKVIHLDRRPVTRVLVPNKSDVIPIPSPPFWKDAPLFLPELSSIFQSVLRYIDDVARVGSDLPDCDGESQLSVPPEPSAGTRKILVPVLEGQRYVVTVHGSGDNPTKDALVLLNSGQIPRNGHGSFSAKLGDVMAAKAMTVYRVDLPGLGDSPGKLPIRTDRFWRHVELGGQVRDTHTILSHIKNTYGHRRLVVGGLCGGANNALYTASKYKNLVDAVLMLECKFDLIGAKDEQPPKDEFTIMWLIKKISTRRTWIRLLTGESRYFHFLRFGKKLLLPFIMRVKTLPSNINLQLAMAFGDVCTRCIPILFIYCTDGSDEVYFKQVLSVLFKEKTPPSLKRCTVANSNHIFTSGRAIEYSIARIEEWITSELSI
jgi:pimeloyl-ACP methyl ester carboxylesterase